MGLPRAVSSSCSFSSPFPSRWTYDVFLSFRGEDARNTFVAHLNKALCQRGIKTYIDDMLRKGDDISPAVVKAIQESRISIVVLSENYASSTWCLEELMKILECKETKQQTVLPVFYKIDPSEVRKQTKNYGKALADLQERFKDDMKVQRWSEALTKVANLSGFHWQKERKESEFIHEIVQRVSRTAYWKYVYVAKFPIGIEARVQNIVSLLSIENSDIVSMLGIFGIGGIGKTTLAKAVYNSIGHHFDGSCFLLDIKTISQRENGLAHLQEKLLSEILEDSTIKVSNEDQGVIEIKRWVCSKKVILILDDVDESKQLEKLAGACNWFGLGSRIIITTRDKHLLVEHEVELQYMAEKLDNNEAFQLFSFHAFHRDKPDDDFMEVTHDTLGYAKGLPLALTILGSDLYGSDVQQWESALESYKKIPHQNIQEILRRSYDRLDYREKNIFLDIACFFRGSDADYVIRILDDCHFSIKKLVDKSLITIDWKTLQMHDLVQDMGREIVRQESNEPGERTRLWFCEDVRHVLEENTGTSKIEGILIELPEQDLIHVSSDVFRKMTRLRLFINRNASFSKGPNYLSNELRVLDWPEYPLPSLPSNFRGEKLVVLNMHASPIKELKAGFKNLTFMDFGECKFLKGIPDLAGNKNLTRLLLDNCTNMVEIHPSIGFLHRLEVLSLVGCSSLSNFPRRLELPSLTVFNLSGCSSLEYFPEIGCEMKNLHILRLQHIGIKELPSSFWRLTGLEYLYLWECANLIYLSSSIWQLQRLKHIWFEDYPNPTNLGNELDCNGQYSFITSAVPTWENEISSGAELLPLPLLKFQYVFRSCGESLSDFKVAFSCTHRPFELDVSGSEIVRLPASIKRFDRLTMLRVSYSEQLQEIPELPAYIQEVHARGCKSLESFPEVVNRFQFNTSNLQKVSWIDLSGCYRLLVNLENHVPKLEPEGFYSHSWGITFPGNRIPDCFSLYREDFRPDSFYIKIDRVDADKVKGVVVCVVIGAVTDQLGLVRATITLRGITSFRQVSRIRELDIRGSNHVWLEYLDPLPLGQYGDQEFEDGGPVLRLEENIDSHLRIFISIDGGAIVKVGVHLVRNNEEKAECHPRVLQDSIDVSCNPRPIKKLKIEEIYQMDSRGRSSRGQGHLADNC